MVAGTGTKWCVVTPLETFRGARLRAPIPYRQDKLPWNEWTLELRAAKKTQPTRSPAQPLSLPVLTYEERTYINDRNQDAVQILPKSDVPSLSGFLELAKWRHDFPPPQNIVAEQLASASAHQTIPKNPNAWWIRNGEYVNEEIELRESLSKIDERRAGPWQHVVAQSGHWSLPYLFRVPFPHVAPKKIDNPRPIPVSVSNRGLSDLHGEVPTCWQEPVKPFTVRFKDWDGRLRKMRIKPAPSKFKLVYHNPKFPLDTTPICDDRKHYFAKERMQREGIRSVRENSVIELVSDALGGAKFKPLDDPLEYLQSFVPEEVPLHPTAPDPQARHEADKEKFAQHAAELEKLRQEYDQAQKLRVQPETLNKLLRKHGFKPELSGLKYRAEKRQSGEKVNRTPFEETLRDDLGRDISIVNVDDGDYLRRKIMEYSEVFRKFYGDNPQQSPEFQRDVYLLQAALTSEWKSDAEKKEWQRRLDRMYFFIYGVCPTGTCLNNRCANPKLSPNERLWTHASNLLQKVAPRKMAQLKVGTFYLVVVRQGQPRLEILKAKRAEQASTEFDRLVESKVKQARASARRQGMSETAAERSVRDAYRAADLLYLASETYPESNQHDVAAD